MLLTLHLNALIFEDAGHDRTQSVVDRLGENIEFFLHVLKPIDDGFLFDHVVRFLAISSLEQEGHVLKHGFHVVSEFPLDNVNTLGVLFSLGSDLVLKSLLLLIDHLFKFLYLALYVVFIVVELLLFEEASQVDAQGVTILIVKLAQF